MHTAGASEAWVQFAMKRRIMSYYQSDTLIKLYIYKCKIKQVLNMKNNSII